MELRKEKFLMNSKHKRKNGGKLTNEALTHKGHTPSKSIKTKQEKKGKKNG